MNYQRTKPTSTRAAKIGIAIAAVLILARLVVPHVFASFFSAVFSPLWRIEHFFVRSSIPENQIIFSSDSAFASSTIAELLEENNSLKSMLGRPEAHNAVIAAVLSKPPFSAYDSLIVDAGSDNGVQIGDKVYALATPVVYSVSTTSMSVATTSSTFPASSTSSTTSAAHLSQNPVIEIPIGQVATTYGATSVITLFSSSGQKYPVEIGLSRISATAVATGAGMFEAMIPNNSNVSVGDPVIVPGIQTGVFASVVSVISDPARPYSLVIFQSPVNPFSLYFVEIEKTNETK